MIQVEQPNAHVLLRESLGDGADAPSWFFDGFVGDAIGRMAIQIVVSHPAFGAIATTVETLERLLMQLKERLATGATTTANIGASASATTGVPLAG